MYISNYMYHFFYSNVLQFVVWILQCIECVAKMKTIYSINVLFFLFMFQYNVETFRVHHTPKIRQEP